jgi:hypothetical protein
VDAGRRRDGRRARRGKRHLLARPGRLEEGPRPREGRGLPDLLRHDAGRRRAGGPRARDGDLSRDEPRDMEWGGRAFAVRDPDGFLVTIATGV